MTPTPSPGRRFALLAVVALAAGAVLLLKPAAAPAVALAATPARLPKLLDLGATSCVPCKAMVPVLAGLEADYAGRLEVEFIDVWQHPEAGAAWKVSIIPTQLFLAADGRELARHEGFFSREDILAQWARLGVRLN